MRCRQCDYPLWNLPARQCPECGAPFLPSQYEFRIGAVQFKCPHCGQTYYGTDERGHLVPREFECVTCRRRIDMDSMVLLPSEGVTEDQTRRRDPLPWLNRKKIGFLRGWFKTVLGGMGASGRLARSLPESSPKGQAWWFAALTLMLAGMLCFSPFLVPALMGGMRGTGFGAVALGAGLAPLLGLAVFGLVVHGAMRLTGVPGARLGRTYELLCYSCGPMLIMGVPCLGVYVSWIGMIWWGASAAVMLSAAYGGRAWKTAIAGTLFSLLLLATPVVLILGAIYSARTATVAAVAAFGTTQVQMTLNTNGFTTPAANATHSAKLVATMQLQQHQLIAPGSASTGSTIKIGPYTLDQFVALSRDAQQAAADAATAALPANVVAHRLGDIVFTYHGVNSNLPAHAMLWTFIVWPDPAVNSAPPASVTVGLAGGSTMTVPASSFGATLQQQNQARAAIGLAPLPDPSTVTHDAPAIGK